MAWPVHEKKKYLWNKGDVKGYEAQTSAREDSIRDNSRKFKLHGIETAWICNNPLVIENIKVEVDDIYEYSVI